MTLAVVYIAANGWFVTTWTVWESSAVPFCHGICTMYAVEMLADSLAVRREERPGRRGMKAWKSQPGRIPRGGRQPPLPRRAFPNPAPAPILRTRSSRTPSAPQPRWRLIIGAAMVECRRIQGTLYNISPTFEFGHPLNREAGTPVVPVDRLTCTRTGSAPGGTGADSNGHLRTSPRYRTSSNRQTAAA